MGHCSGVSVGHYCWQRSYTAAAGADWCVNLCTTLSCHLGPLLLNLLPSNSLIGVAGQFTSIKAQGPLVAIKILFYCINARPLVGNFGTSETP